MTDDVAEDEGRIIHVHGHEVRVRGFDPSEVEGGMAPGRVPFNELVGLRFTLISPERVEVVLKVTPDHHQPSGMVHGGVYTTLVEAAGSTGSVAHVAAEGRFAVGTHNSTSFVRPVHGGLLTAVARPVHLGRTQHLWDVRVIRNDGKLAAKGELRTAIIDPGDDT